MKKFQRNVMEREEMEKLILQQLNPEPKTYDEIAKDLDKGRSTIQSHYIPILEKKGLIKRIGKRKQAWLFSITEKGLDFINC
jgi:predicted transcriptional regulator